MGCGASKESTAVSPSVLDNKPLKSAEKTTSAPSSNNTLSKPVVPSINQSKKTNKIGQSIAFEIPIDDLFDASKQVVQRTSSGKLSQLPALSLSQQDIQAKLANTEERWKDLAAGDDGKKRRKKGMKPKLKSRKHEEDPETLKMRLHEREVAAQLNREKEITKLQLKLARQEEHARKVLERKRAMGGDDGELRLSCGGEDGKGLGELADQAESLKNSSSASSSSKKLKEELENGSGASRGSSGRSQTTDTTEVDDHIVPAANPLKVAAKGVPLASLAPKAKRAIA